MGDITASTPAGSHVWHGPYLKRGILIEVHAMDALIVFVSKPTEVVSVPLGCLSLIAEMPRTATRLGNPIAVTQTPTVPVDDSYWGNACQNTGTLQGIIPGLAQDVRSLNEGIRLRNWIIVENTVDLLARMVVRTHNAIRPISDGHATELAARKPLDLTSQVGSDKKEN